MSKYEFHGIQDPYQVGYLMMAENLKDDIAWPENPYAKGTPEFLDWEFGVSECWEDHQ